MSNNAYIAGCRAVDGIVDTHLTGPLWSPIQSTKHILDLNQICYTSLNDLQIFSDDYSELLKRKSLYLNFTNRNHVYDALFDIDEEKLNMTNIFYVLIF